MTKTEDQYQHEAVDEISSFGATDVTCNWSDNEGVWIVTVDFGDNHKCQSKSATRRLAYRDAVTAAKTMSRSLGK